MGCRKMTCDVTKVTYNMYSCDTCCMSREMMEMDGQHRATCQNPREGTNGIMEILNDNKRKIQIVSSPTFN